LGIQECIKMKKNYQIVNQKPMKKISEYLNVNHVTFLDVESRDDTLRAMIEEANLPDKEVFHNAIIEREKIVSTSVGMGVAIPHAKLDIYDDFFIIIGILRKGVDWNALDDTPVRLVFMIGGPDDKQTEYLQILSGLTSAIKDEERRKKMLTVTTPEEVIELFNAL